MYKLKGIWVKIPGCKSISIASLVHFYPFLGLWLPHFWEFGPNDLKFSENVLWVKLLWLCKKSNHWRILAMLTLFQRVIFQKIWNQDTILANFGYFVPPKSGNVVQLTEIWYLLSCKGYAIIMSITQFLHNATSRFFKRFDSFKSDFYPLKRRHEKNLMKFCAGVWKLWPKFQRSNWWQSWCLAKILIYTLFWEC